MEQPAEKDDDEVGKNPHNEGDGDSVESEDTLEIGSDSKAPIEGESGEALETDSPAPDSSEELAEESEEGEFDEEDEFDDDEDYDDEEPEEKAPPLPAGILRNQPFLTFLFPFIVFMMVGSLEPPHPDDVKPDDEHGGNFLVIDFEYSDYPKIYTAKIVLTVLAMLFVIPGYRTFPFSVHWEALVVGVLGAIAWIFLCELKLEDQLYSYLGMTDLFDLARRPGFNPLEEMKATPGLAYAFLGVRLFGLVVVVAIMEEFFLRGFVMRMFVDFDYWEEVRFGRWNDLALAAGTLVPILTHPKTELLAVVVWFSAVTWLMLRRNSIWDCITAHAITNLIIGCYVVYSGSWWLM